MGVLVGCCNFDWELIEVEGPGAVFKGAGTIPEVLANRVSYALGLRGACFLINSACSSSLVGALVSVE